jgi:CheY-like chemotaxis protein
MSDSYRVLYAGRGPPEGNGPFPPEGGELSAVGTLEAARDAVADGGVDCVVSEQDLPDGEGLDLLEAVRRERPGLPFVLFADGSERLAADAVAADVTEYVPRSPVDAAERLGERVGNAVPGELDAVAVRGVDDAVTGVADRRELETGLCEALVGSTPVRSAWFGAVDADGFTPRTGAGPDDPSLVGAASPDPAADGIARGGTGDGTVATVPVRRRGTDYGVLALAAGGGALADGEALSELGERAGRSVHAAACRQGLMAANVVELELGVRRPDHFLHRAALVLDAAFSVEGVVAQRDGSYVMDVSVEGASAEAAFAELSGMDEVAEARVLTGEGLLALALSDPPELRSTLAEHGATLSSLDVHGADATAVAQLPNTTAVRAVVEAVRDIGDTALHAKRSRRRRAADGGGVFGSGLTERQRDALETAYDSGYFDWPRSSTGEQVASRMDIAPPTLQEHLRTAQSKLLTSFFEDRAEG